MAKIIRFGRRIKGGGVIAKVNIDMDIIEIELDPKKFPEPVIDAIHREVTRRIGAITKLPAPATIERRGRGPLFNVTGTLRGGITKEFVGNGWALLLPASRALPRLARRKLTAVGKIGLQSLLKVATVKQAVQDALPNVITRVIGKEQLKTRRIRTRVT